VWVLPRNAVAAARVGISRGVIGGLIGVVVVCLGSFRVGNLGKWVKSRVLGHIDAGWCSGVQQCSLWLVNHVKGCLGGFWIVFWCVGARGKVLGVAQRVDFRVEIWGHGGG
jgi:hypothetical protein